MMATRVFASAGLGNGEACVVRGTAKDKKEAAIVNTDNRNRFVFIK
jgi:hypothetical protein